MGYSWTKDDNKKVLTPKSDNRWVSIRDYVISVGNWVMCSVSRRLPAPALFVYEVARLRGTHGRMLLDNLRCRISDADILVMDIGSSDGKSYNPNVLLETGMAIARQDGAHQDLFILKPYGLEAPSDLKGFLFTDYEVIDDGCAIKLIDVQGFQAALRSAVLRKARERNMIGPRKGCYAGLEDECEGNFTTLRNSNRTKVPRSTTSMPVKLSKKAGRIKK